MIRDTELKKMKGEIFEGMYDGTVLYPLVRKLSDVDKDRQKAKEYIKENKLENTTPGRAFLNAEKHLTQALMLYNQSKKLLDKLR